MNDDPVLELCENLPAAELTFPFGFETAVYKVRGKIFAVAPVDGAHRTITLKADPEDALVLVRDHDGITPGYHMNKRHWVTVDLDGDVPEDLVAAMVDESYRLVVLTLPKARRPVG